MGRGKEKIPRELIKLSYTDLKNKIINIPDKRDRALIATTYAGYGRIGEVLRGPHKGSNPMKKEDVKLIIKEGRKFVQLSIQTEKRKDLFIRQPVVSTDREKWLAQIIWNWVKELPAKSFLFPGHLINSALTTRSGELIFEKHFCDGIQSIHLLRSWRSTHALQGAFTLNHEKVSVNTVMEYGGWKEPETLLKIYNQAMAEDSMGIL